MVGFEKVSVGRDLYFTVPKKYEIKKMLGKGAHGAVVLAYDKEEERLVAIKKLITPLTSPLAAQRVYRELSLMKHCHHVNKLTQIIRIYDVYCLGSDASTPTTKENMEDIYIVMEYMEYTLKEVYERFELSLEQISFIIYQIACALNFMQALGIWHRDLKPANIGVDVNLTVKIFDFGLARADVDSNQRSMRLTSYVMTRYYRAPEVILGLEYNEKVDMWSLGCILGELLFRNVLFEGQDELDQWSKIARVLGAPPPSMLQRLNDTVKLYIEREATRITYANEQNQSVNYNIFEDIRSRHLAANTGNSCTGDNAADCLSKMLTLDPSDRISVEELIQHPFLEKYRWHNGEVVPSQEVSKKIRDFQRPYNNRHNGIDFWRDTIYTLINETWRIVESPSPRDSPISPFRPPQPLPQSTVPPTTLSSNLLVWSLPLAVVSYYFLARFRPSSSRQQRFAAGCTAFLATFITSRFLRKN